MASVDARESERRASVAPSSPGGVPTLGTPPHRHYHYHLPRSRRRRIVGVLGPGWITGASDDDPSGIATDVVAGPTHGYALLWPAPWCLPLMAAIQFVCATVGMVSGRGLAGVVRDRYPRWLLLPAVVLLVVANTINAGADIGASAAAINLLLPALGIQMMIVPLAALMLVLQVVGSSRLIARIF